MTEVNTGSAGLIFEKLVAVNKSIESISKDRKNQAQGFKFRGIDDVYNSLHKPLSDNEVFIVPKILKHDVFERTTKNGGVNFQTIVMMEYTFRTTDGSSVSCVVVGEANDMGDKGAGKAMSYALKSALFQMFTIPTEGDNDPDAHSVTYTSSPSKAAPAKPMIEYKDAVYEKIAKAITETGGYTLEQIKTKYDLSKEAEEWIVKLIKIGKVA